MIKQNIEPNKQIKSNGYKKIKQDLALMGHHRGLSKNWNVITP